VILPPKHDYPEHAKVLETVQIPGGEPLTREPDEDGEVFSRRVAVARAAGAERLKAAADKKHVVNWRSHMAASFDTPLSERSS
jgi:hypothetical protein